MCDSAGISGMVSTVASRSDRVSPKESTKERSYALVLSERD